eukprot:c20030_g1_i8.p1 GENE.c20030_g1_i8~~c20030_g1_i8.p1  ORF type:complete len:123 (+),score=13.59 c20030_g1_i8:291-659(+)
MPRLNVLSISHLLNPSPDLVNPKADEQNLIPLIEHFVAPACDISTQKINIFARTSPCPVPNSQNNCTGSHSSSTAVELPNSFFGLASRTPRDLGGLDFIQNMLQPLTALLFFVQFVRFHARS